MFIGIKWSTIAMLFLLSQIVISEFAKASENNIVVNCEVEQIYPTIVDRIFRKRDRHFFSFNLEFNDKDLTITKVFGEPFILQHFEERASYVNANIISFKKVEWTNVNSVKKKILWEGIITRWSGKIDFWRTSYLENNSPDNNPDGGFPFIAWYNGQCSKTKKI